MKRAKVKTWYVEISKPPYPAKGEEMRVFRMDQWNADVLSPCMVHLWKCRGAANRKEAILMVLTHRAFKMYDYGVPQQPRV